MQNVTGFSWVAFAPILSKPGFLVEKSAGSGKIHRVKGLENGNDNFSF